MSSKEQVLLPSLDPIYQLDNDFNVLYHDNLQEPELILSKEDMNRKTVVPNITRVEKQQHMQHLIGQNETFINSDNNNIINNNNNININDIDENITSFDINNMNDDENVSNIQLSKNYQNQFENEDDFENEFELKHDDYETDFVIPEDTESVTRVPKPQLDIPYTVVTNKNKNNHNDKKNYIKTLFGNNNIENIIENNNSNNNIENTIDKNNSNNDSNFKNVVLPKKIVFLNKKPLQQQEKQPTTILQQEKQEYIDPTKRIRKPNSKYFNESYVNALKLKLPVADVRFEH